MSSDTSSIVRELETAIRLQKETMRNLGHVMRARIPGDKTWTKDDMILLEKKKTELTTLQLRLEEVKVSTALLLLASPCTNRATDSEV